MIWSDLAIDYSKGVDIYDLKENKIYTYEEAKAEKPDIRKRLINKPRKIGCYVLTLEECDELLKKRRKKI